MMVHRRDSILTEVSRAGLIASGAVVAMVAAFWMKRKQIARRSRTRRKRRSLRAEQMRHMLSRAIVGNSQDAILSIFGPPRSSAGFSIAISSNTKNAFLGANTWYYVLDNADRRAMVIEFENGIARNAEFIRGIAMR
jgi:hypothetical protein